MERCNVFRTSCKVDLSIENFFRRIVWCRKGMHRFVEVVSDDPVEMIAGFYCVDCLKYVSPSDISSFRATCEVYDDTITLEDD